MARACPNESSEEWKELVNAVGENNAYIIFYDNNEQVPSKENMQSWIDRVNTQENKTANLNRSKEAEDIINDLDNPLVERTEDGRAYRNKKTGEVINKRVSDLVKSFARQMRTDYKGEPNDYYGKKGTVIHKYLEEIGQRIADGRDISYDSVREEVLNLRQLDLFKEDNEEFFHLSTQQFKLLREGMQDLISSIERIQNEQVDADGKVEFRFEVPVFDPYREENGLAGTVDMIAVFSDGSAAVYDFKTFNAKGKRQQEPNPYKVEQWSVQMINYKNMLKDTYGINMFRQSRVVPVSVSFSQKTQGEWVNEIYKGFQTLGMQNNRTSDSLKHLDPIPIEELTGEKNLDRLIETLIDEKRKTQELMRGASREQHTRLRNKFARINRQLKNIQLSRDISGTMKDINSLIKRYRERLFLDQQNPKSMSYHDLSDALDEMTMYESISLDFKNQLDQYPQEQRKKIRNRMDEIQNSVKRLQEDLLDEMVGRFGNNITDPGDNLTVFGRVFQGIQNWNIPVFQKLNELVRNSEERTRRQTQKEFKRLFEVDEAFSEWAKKNGYSAEKKFSLLYNEETGNLYQEYNKDFWSKRHEIREKAEKGKKLTVGEKEFIETYFEFDQEAYEIRRDKSLTIIQQDLDNGEITESVANRRREQFYKQHSIKNNPENIYKSWYLTPKTEAKGIEQWQTDEWRFIQQHEPVKNYYNFIVEYNEYWSKELGITQIGRHFLPNVQKGILDTALEFGPKNAGTFLETVKKQFEIREYDEIAGAVDKKTGEPLQKIPILYADPLRNPLSPKAQEEIRQEVIKDVEVTHEPGTELFDAEVERRIRNEEFSRGRRAKSRDLTASMGAMIYSVNNYVNMTGIEGQVRALTHLVKSEKIVRKDLDKFDKTLIDKTTGTIAKHAGLLPDMQKAFESFAKQLVYGQRLEKDTLLFDKYSLNKITRGFMDYLSARALGVNIIIQTADWIQGRTGVWMLAKEGRHFDKRSLKDMMDQYADRDDKYANIVEFFEPSNRDMRMEEIELSKANFVSRRFRNRTMYLGYIWADDNISRNIAVAMANKWVVDSDGKIKNPDPAYGHNIIDKNAPKVIDSIVREGDQLTIPGLSIEEFASFRDKIRKVQYLARGTLNERQKSVHSNKMLFNMLMQFRSWIPGLAESKWGKLKYDNTFETYEVGRFNVGFSEILGNGMLKTLGETTKLLSEAVSMGLYKKELNHDTVERQLQKFLEENPDRKPNTQEEREQLKQQMIALRKAKLEGFIAEMRVYLTFFVLIQLLGGLDWDEEEAEGGLFTWNAYQLAQRALLEASFWWSPRSADEILRRPVPLWGMFTELQKMIDNSLIEAHYMYRGDRDPRDRTPPGYYTLKNVPAVNQVLDIMGFFDEYNPPRGAIERILTSEDEE